VISLITRLIAGKNGAEIISGELAWLADSFALRIFQNLFKHLSQYQPFSLQQCVLSSILASVRREYSPNYSAPRAIWNQRIACTPHHSDSIMNNSSRGEQKLRY
jgi:hypothetical protein